MKSDQTKSKYKKIGRQGKFEAYEELDYTVHTVQKYRKLRDKTNLK